MVMPCSYYYIIFSKIFILLSSIVACYFIINIAVSPRSLILFINFIHHIAIRMAA